MTRVSVVIPVYNEGEAIERCVDQLLDAITFPAELLFVYDDPSDTTVAPLERRAALDARVKPTLNTYGRGPAKAIRFGVDAATSPVVVVTMADGSDDPHQIDELTKLVERGVVVAAASRYMKGGQQVGGPLVKASISRLAGITLHWVARVGTHDPPNSFKAYDREFVRSVGIDSDAGFAIGLELVAKARRSRQKVAEIPTIWLDRVEGESNFRMREWLMVYLKWWFFAFGPKSEPESLNARKLKEIDS